MVLRSRLFGLVCRLWLLRFSFYGFAIYGLGVCVRVGLDFVVDHCGYELLAFLAGMQAVALDFLLRLYFYFFFLRLIVMTRTPANITSRIVGTKYEYLP